MFADSLTSPSIALPISAIPGWPNIRQVLTLVAEEGNRFEGQAWVHDFSGDRTPYYGVEPNPLNRAGLWLYFTDDPEHYATSPIWAGPEVPVGPVTVHYWIEGYTTATLRTTLANPGGAGWTPVLVPDGSPTQGPAPSLLTPTVGRTQMVASNWITGGGCAPALNMAVAVDPNGDGVHDSADIVRLPQVLAGP
jgi:hypothetical protein